MDLKQRIAGLSKAFDSAYTRLGIAELVEELDKLNAQMTKPDFWSDSDTAQEVSRQAGDLKNRVDPWEKLKKEIHEISELIELDSGEMAVELNQQFDQISDEFEQLKEQLKFQGPYDDHAVIL